MLFSLGRRVLPLLLLYSPVLSSAQDAFRVSKLQSECGTLYTVVAGDGCWAIADNAKITLGQLAALNPDLNCETLGVGDGVCLGLPCGNTYVVQSGEWCGKIEGDHNISEELLMSLNPGLVCADLFVGQKLCIEPPPVVQPPDPDPTPSLPPDGVPSVPCSKPIPVSVGDTCSGLSGEFGIQLSQFTAMNKNLDCANLQPGNIACVFPNCGRWYKVQQGDSCPKIEGDVGVGTGKLVGLNPGLDCDKLLENQSLCVEPADEPTSDHKPATFEPWRKYPTFSTGHLPKSPLVSFVNAEDSRETFYGDMIFHLDSQHKETFDRVDLNKDGKLDKSELDILYAVYPHLGTGVAELDDTITQENYVESMIQAVDRNDDGAIDLNEYMAAVFSAQNLTTTSSQIALKARMTGDMGLHQKRFIPLLVAGAVGILGIIGIANIAVMMGEMEKKARDDAGDLLNYLDITFWDRGNQQQPKCAAFMYYSSSCAAIGHSWSSHCSHGGEKVYASSCQGLFTTGSKACGFLGCSSLCYKIDTENCDCDSLKYITENQRDYSDAAVSNTQETGVGPCRNRCRGTIGCVGFTISRGNDDNHIRCKVFKSMNSPQANSHSVAFKLVGSPVGSGTNPLCPRVPDGYFPIPPEQERRNEELGEQLSDRYAEIMGFSSAEMATRELESYDPRERKNLTQGALESIIGRADPSFDPRGTYAILHAFSTVIEGTVQHRFNRPSVIHPISPTWIHKCRIMKGQKEGSNFDRIMGHVHDSYLATEDCMKLSDWTSISSPSCINNGCAASKYGRLPYVTKQINFDFTNNINKVKLDAVKDHLKNVGPLFIGSSIPDKFQRYARDLQRGQIPKNEVYYDSHPRYLNAPPCTPGGHAMAVVGYGEYRRTAQSRIRLYWIVQNSWGTRSGDGGFLNVDYASIGATKWGPYAVNVDEGAQWFSNNLPPYPGKHDEL